MHQLQQQLQQQQTRALLATATAAQRLGANTRRKINKTNGRLRHSPLDNLSRGLCLRASRNT